VWVGAFLSKADADAAGAALKKETGVGGFARPL
jgi:hypothetical protein